ncbi:MAG: GNAT family N-acetyltransferase [Elusimicrobia bacterium]|nr:GNAT family N-acetyltransferase [Elusimicrobiota bacterium]
MPSSFSRPDLRLQAPLQGGRKALVRLAAPADAPSIRALYNEVYQGKYPLSIIYDAHETVDSLHKENYSWLVGETDGRLVSSVIFCVDPDVKLAKVFGAVVHPQFRGSGLTQRAIGMGIRHLVEETGQANSVYATARTISAAPQKLLKNLGFKELGVFPNVRKVDNYETHCLSAYFQDGALSRRITPPKLPTALKPFYDIVRKAAGLEDAQWHELALTPPSPYSGGWMEFEHVEAPNFILERWERLKSERKLHMQFFPFHKPNLLLVSRDPPAEIYLHHSRSDHHAVIIGGHEKNPDLTHLLNSIVIFLEERGVRYLELLVDAYHPKVLKQVLDARFLPSAYYPAMRWKRGKGRDYIVFSKSFVVLDFKNISAQGLFREYLDEYFGLWRLLYIDAPQDGAKARCGL